MPPKKKPESAVRKDKRIELAPVQALELRMLYRTLKATEQNLQAAHAEVQVFAQKICADVGVDLTSVPPDRWKVFPELGVIEEQ